MDKRILLIDFDPVAAELTGALLATRGIPFTLARNHAELDRALAAGPPALVVIDPARPDETEGLRLCTSVAERLGPGARVPIILASRSLRGARWKTLARDAGAELFLERPKDDRLLLAAAERALREADAAPASRQPAPTAVPPAARAAAPPAPGRATTTDSQRTPPPPENELEDMVDQMFAQWFADGEGSGLSAPAPSPAPAPPPAGSLAPAAARAGAAAAVLDPPCADSVEVDRASTGSVRPSAPQPAPVDAVPPPAPTGPAAAPARPAPAAPPRPAAPPQPAAATLAPPQPAAATPAPPVTSPAVAASAGPGANRVRPLAIAAAVALIGLGAGFVVLQKAGGPEETATEMAVSTPQAAQPPADQPSIAAEPAAVTAAATLPVATPPPATGLPAPAAKVVPEGPAAEPPAPAKTVPRTGSPIQKGAAIAPSPAALPPATPPPPTASPSPATAPAVATIPEASAGSEVPDPQPEAAEFIPDVAPDGTLPAAEVASAATSVRYVGPEVIASTRATPAFPPGARQMRMSGQVRLQVKVRADGSVGAVTVLSEPKPVVGFGKAAEAAVRQWRYRPATMGSRAVDSEVVVVVNFAGD